MHSAIYISPVESDIQSAKCFDSMFDNRPDHLRNPFSKLKLLILIFIEFTVSHLLIRQRYFFAPFSKVSIVYFSAKLCAMVLKYKLIFLVLGSKSL